MHGGAHRANWLRKAYGYIQLPKGIHRTVQFFIAIYRVPEHEVIRKVSSTSFYIIIFYS